LTAAVIHVKIVADCFAISLIEVYLLFPERIVEQHIHIKQVKQAPGFPGKKQIPFYLF
jgi:hypothetical protein